MSVAGGLAQVLPTRHDEAHVSSKNLPATAMCLTLTALEGGRRQDLGEGVVEARPRHPGLVCSTQLIRTPPRNTTGA